MEISWDVSRLVKETGFIFMAPFSIVNKLVSLLDISMTFGKMMYPWMTGSIADSMLTSISSPLAAVKSLLCFL